MNSATAGADEVTVIVALLPVMPLTVLVAVTVWLPAVFKVTLKLPVPLLREALPGRAAWPSLLVK